MERRAIAVHGTVQGVGFRPFVYGLASRLKLSGFVSNSSGGVRIEIEGEAPQLDQFLSDLTVRPPPLARIDDLIWERQPLRGDRDFHIEQSVIDPRGQVIISPDVATCDACLAEVFDPGNRRYRYPFLNCTHCGPRLTIVTGAPYDRERTTMARFVMCADCRTEYENPLDRRFHAQPSACPVCGPRLSAADSRGREVAGEDPLQWFIEALRAGRIGAMKGLGGYHLICDARQDSAVAELRRRKHRDEKPFAVMVGDLDAAERLCEISPAERELLISPRRPIVLLRQRPSRTLPDIVAPGNPILGVMLPYTPLHHLLMREMNAPLVMTSGNRSDEPIATSEPDVFERLAGIADLFLTHNRPIHVRCDDSVTRVIGRAESPIRRSRGDAPQPIRLPLACKAPILAVGGQLKGTFALGRGPRAIVSHHLGDLDHFEAYRAFEKDVALYERLFAIRPQYIAHDLHPDYASTRYAKKRAAAEGVTLIPIQHHHAHMASCMAEHGIDEPVIGVSFDGTGFGTDGAVWGGEFLVGDFKSFRQAAHLRYVPMPGGEKAVKEPWRMAIAHLADAQVDCPSLRNRIEPQALRAVEQMLVRRFNTPLTSSAGRLFDAVAAMIGLRDRVSFEGQAAMELEWLATTAVGEVAYSFDVGRALPADRSLGGQCPPYMERSGSVGSAPRTANLPGDGTVRGAEPTHESMRIDTRPMIRAIAEDVEAAIPSASIARRFHTTMVAMIVQTCICLREVTGITKIVLSGGAMMNSLLKSETELHLKNFGFFPFHHHIVPSNDGGLSLGQLAIAACQIGETSCA